VKQAFFSCCAVLDFIQLSSKSIINQ